MSNRKKQDVGIQSQLRYLHDARAISVQLLNMTTSCLADPFMFIPSSLSNSERQVLTEKRLLDMVTMGH